MEHETWNLEHETLVMTQKSKTFHILRSTFQGNKAQVMILTVLALGGTMLGATTIAGLLMVYQIRQATDLGNSGKAIFAADTGLEWGLYQFFKPGSGHAPPAFSNGATSILQCFNASGGSISCEDLSATSIRAVGKSANVTRAFQLVFSF